MKVVNLFSTGTFIGVLLTAAAALFSVGSDIVADGTVTADEVGVAIAALVGFATAVKSRHDEGSVEVYTPAGLPGRDKEDAIADASGDNGLM